MQSRLLNEIHVSRIDLKVKKIWITEVTSYYSYNYILDTSVALAIETETGNRCCMLTSFPGAGINFSDPSITILTILITNSIVHTHSNDVDSVCSQVVKDISSTLYFILIVANVLGNIIRVGMFYNNIVVWSPCSDGRIPSNSDTCGCGTCDSEVANSCWWLCMNRNALESK